MGNRKGAVISSQAAIKLDKYLDLMQKLDKTGKVANKRLELNKVYNSSMSILCKIIIYIESDNELYSIFFNSEVFIKAKDKAVFLPE